MNYRRTTSLIAAAGITVALLSGVASLAHADVDGIAASRTVRYDDLNLSTQAGVQSLYRRIQNAARDVCGPEDVPGTRLTSRAWKDCVSGSIRQAVLSVNKPALTAYYAVRLRDVPFATAG
jgi:UrcA family protein